MKNLIIISADHRGDCLLGMSFNKESKVLTVTHLLENIDSRDGIISQLEPMIENLFPQEGKHDSINFVCIDNEVLANYIGQGLTVRGRLRRPVKGELPVNPKESKYRLKCAINEGSLRADGWIDQIEMALDGEITPERIEGHLVLALTFGVDKFLTFNQNPLVRSSKSQRRDDFKGFCLS
jgi:hypothetical protein